MNLYLNLHLNLDCRGCVTCQPLTYFLYVYLVYFQTGEMGYIRVEVGKNLLGLEGEVAWATPKSWTEANIPCNEDGANCSDGSGTTHGTVFYEDPSLDTEAVQRRLVEHSKSNVQRRLR